MSTTLMPSNGPMDQPAPDVRPFSAAFLCLGSSNGRRWRRSRRAQRMGVCAHLLLRPGIALLDQPLEVFILLTDAVGDPRLVLLARRRGGLLDQLPDVV